MKVMRNKNNRLWCILLNVTKGAHTFEGKKPKAHTNNTKNCNNIHRINKIQDVLAYLHASLFSKKNGIIKRH